MFQESFLGVGCFCRFFGFLGTNLRIYPRWSGKELRPLRRNDILSCISQLHKTKNITVVLVSHSMEDIAKYVDRIVVMNKGCKMLEGVPKEVFSHYKELESVGLAAPQVSYIMHALVERGIPVDTQATTISEAVETISQILIK